MIACCFSADREKILSFMARPPLTDSVNLILAPLTDFEKTLSKNLLELPDIWFIKAGTAGCNK